MEGGGDMEGRGSGVEDRRGEAHLGLSFSVSACHRPCPLVVSHVHVSWLCCPWSTHRCPWSAHRCLWSAHRCPWSAHRCLWSTRHSPRPFTFVGIRFHSWAWVVVFVHGRSSSFGGVCLRLSATAGCGGGSHSLVVVSPRGWRRRVVAWPLWLCCGARWCMSWLSRRHLVAMSPAHVASCDVAPLVSVSEEAGRCCVAYLGWARPGCRHRRCGVVVGTRWWWWMGCMVNGGGGGKEEATTWQWSSHSCRIWEATCQGGVYGVLVYDVTKPL